MRIALRCRPGATDGPDQADALRALQLLKTELETKAADMRQREAAVVQRETLLEDKEELVEIGSKIKQVRAPDQRGCLGGCGQEHCMKPLVMFGAHEGSATMVASHVRLLRSRPALALPLLLRCPAVPVLPGAAVPELG